MRKILLIIISITFLTGCQKNSEFKIIEVGENQLKVEIVQTAEKMAKGLSGRQSLPQDQGMLFIYPDYQKPHFWMKAMNFPLDIIWIKDGRIAEITENIPIPNSADLTLHQPKEPINYVLEVNAGWVKGHEVKVGDKITIP